MNKENTKNNSRKSVSFILCLVFIGFFVAVASAMVSSISPDRKPRAWLILGDSFSSYRIFDQEASQGKDFQEKLLKQANIKLRYANEFDPKQRAERLNDDAELIVMSLDQFLEQNPQGKIVGLINISMGADAVVLNTPEYRQLRSKEALQQLIKTKQEQGQKMAITFAANTPSNFLAQTFDEEELEEDLVKVLDIKRPKHPNHNYPDASHAWEELQNSKDVAIAILWEPYVTLAKQNGYTVVFSSEDRVWSKVVDRAEDKFWESLNL